MFTHCVNDVEDTWMKLCYTQIDGRQCRGHDRRQVTNKLKVKVTDLKVTNLSQSYEPSQAHSQEQIKDKNYQNYEKCQGERQGHGSQGHESATVLKKKSSSFSGTGKREKSPKFRDVLR